MLAILATLASFAALAFAHKGVDVSQAAYASNWECLKKDGRTFGIVRCYKSDGKVDTTCPHTIYNAKDGGISEVDIYFFPDFHAGDAKGQVDSMVHYLKGFDIANGNGKYDYGRLWFDIEGTQYWGSTSENVAFIKGLMSAASAHGIKHGIYTSASQWGPITGDSHIAKDLPLWYAHYDGVENFGDFNKFGGWDKPHMKQYKGDVTVCGVGVDENYKA